MPQSTISTLDVFVITGAILVCIIAGVAYFIFDCGIAHLFHILFIGLALVGIPAGIAYGTQKKDDYWS